jgi:antitoxin (DNA-binding transcriptional repressor) of toxin-antitoxin stability system
MTVVSTLEFRKNAKVILGRILQGQRVVLTYRGKAVARLDPIR